MSLDDRTTLVKAAADASRLAQQHVRFDYAYSFNAAIGAARFVLDNGLTIIYAPDFRAPVFAYQTWFKVGSKHEDPTRTGLAHLFEHLMFKGTQRHAAGEFDREMERRGTQTNAATWVDWTYYHEALAAQGDNFATVVDFEVDRMSGLVLDATTFASELEVVKNERRMSIDDSVSGSLSEQLSRLAYTTHPYRWPTIGSMEHLAAASIADLEHFYRTYYAPNNAIVVVVGALELVPTLTELARRYGALLAQPIAPRARTPEPRQQAPRRVTIERSVVVPQLCVGYHAPGQGELDFIAAQMLGDVLVEGDNARLYRRLVTDDQLAASVEGALLPFGEPGLYEIFVAARPGVQPDDILAAMQEELDRLPLGIEPDEEERVRASIELNFFDGLKSAVGIAEALGHYQANFSDFSLCFVGRERLAQVTTADLMRVAREVFRGDNGSTVIALPGPSAAGGGGNG